MSDVPLRQGGGGQPPELSPEASAADAVPAAEAGAAAEPPAAEESPLERRYRLALEAIANGRPVEVLIAEAALQKKRPNFVVRALRGAGRNLATITALAVAISGGVFSYVQFRADQARVEADKRQKVEELKLKRVETLNDLLPSLTAESPDTRRYATSVLLSLYSNADTGEDERRMLDENISQVANAETLEALGVLRKSEAFKKKAAELFAARAEHGRREMEAADARKDFDKARLHLNAARADADRALSLDPGNAKALHQRAVIRYEHERGSHDEALSEFGRVISLMEQAPDRMDKNTYLRAHLRRAIVLFERDRRVSGDVCAAFREAERKFAELCWTMDPKDPVLARFKRGCGKSPAPATPCPTAR
jgi:hypothetical protein